MWHKFSPNQFLNKIIIRRVLLGTFLTLFCLPLIAQEKTTPVQEQTETPPQEETKFPGLLESFVEYIEIDKSKYTKKYNLLKSRGSIQNVPIDMAKVDLDPDYINTILFYTPVKYAQLSFANFCNFYDLMLNDLWKTYTGDMIMIREMGTGKDPKIESRLIKQNNFLNAALVQGCKKSAALNYFFSTQKLKQTMSKIELKTPNDFDLCLKQHEKLLADPKTPYYCRIYNNIKEGEVAGFKIPNAQRNSLSNLSELRSLEKRGNILRDALSDTQFKFIENLCTNLISSKKFCDGIFNKNFWTKIAEGEEDQRYIKNYCQEIVQSEELSKNQLEVCASEMTKKTDICHFSTSKYPSLTPKPDCNSISNALNKSRLKDLNKDCPGRIGNDAITNLSRIYAHFKEIKYQDFENSCFLERANSFIEYNLKNENENAWGTKLCFMNPITAELNCEPTLVGNHPSSTYSLQSKLVTALAKIRGIDPSTKCDTTAKSIYNPDRLKFKTGCHIIYDEQLCNATQCPVEFYYNGVLVDKIKLNSDIDFDYYEFDQKRANYAQINLIEKALDKKHRIVRNLTMVKFFLKQSKKAIIHGIGCAEDLLPSFFKRETMNQCRPLPFLIDGTMENDEKFSLITRTALDDNFAPRVVDWNHIFNAVKQYELLSPTNQWSLYALF